MTEPTRNGTNREELPPPRAGWARWVPFAVLLSGAVLFFALGLQDYIGIEQLKAHREALTDWVLRYGLVAGLAYALAYAAMTAFSIPGGAIATIVAGFLFGLWLGTLIVLVGATIGATALFLAARTALGDLLRRRAGGALKRMEAGFRRDALSYLLVLRLVPIFPFFLVNLVPALLGVSLRVFVIGTFFGIIPGTLVYASVGNGLGALLDRGESPDLGIIFEPEILLPILGLAVLASLPIVYRRWRDRKEAR